MYTTSSLQIRPQSLRLAWLPGRSDVLRKLDMTLIPVVWVLYMFNYLDRNNIAYAEPASPACVTCF